MKRLVLCSAALCLAFSLSACVRSEETSILSQTTPESTDSPITISDPVISSSSTETKPPLPELPAAFSDTGAPGSINEDLPYKAYSLYCVEDNRFIVGEGVEVSVAPASLTKLLTASVALRYVKPGEVFTVGTEQDLVNIGSSLCYIQKGQRLRMYDLITGLLMVSGNDAAYTIAVSTARSVTGNSAMSDTEAVAYFCGLMNDFASELGMSKSHFATPDGWDDPEQYTTAYDLTLLARYALTVPEIREIVAAKKKYVNFASGENIIWTNANQLLNPKNEFYCEDAIGMKTGFTDNAGNCLIAAFLKNKKTYISVLMGGETKRIRYGVTAEKWREYM